MIITGAAGLPREKTVDFAPWRRRGHPSKPAIAAFGDGGAEACLCPALQVQRSRRGETCGRLARRSRRWFQLLRAFCQTIHRRLRKTDIDARLDPEGQKAFQSIFEGLGGIAYILRNHRHA
jgi:hypothetical protein